MKKPILIIFALFVLIQNGFSQFQCALNAPSIVCNEERITIFYDTDATFTQVKIDAFTVINGTQVIAIQENKTDTSADIVFLAGGDAEIIVRFLNGNSLTSLCNANVFVLDEEPIPALGMLSNFVDDQVTCEVLDLVFDMFIICTDCPFYWTLNDEIIELEQQISVDNILQQINARLIVDGVGAYTFCHHILKQDSSCFVKDCISIDIVEVDVQPTFALDEEESIFCRGASLHFINETIVEEEVFYIWEIEYDSLKWKYSGEDLDFDFLFSGEYAVSLQYSVVSDDNCVSEKTTMNVNITDSPIIPISCSSNSCQDSVFTYQAPIDCENYEWVIDENLGEIISTDTSGITVKWNNVDQYTETKVRLFLNSCAEDACEETFREVILFPQTIVIEGPKGICDKGEEWYTADFIPGALYTWEIEMLDSISGISPEIIKLEKNKVRIAYYSYVGQLVIRVNASIASKECAVSNEIISTSLFILTNDNLCPGGLFKAFVLPNIDDDVVWTLTNSQIGYFKQQTISGQNDFFAFDLNTAGDYILNVAVPSLEFECGDDIPLTILDSPEVILDGPLYVCPGDSVTYTLAGLGGNDHVEWTIFQNNTSTDYIGNEITILWTEGGGPFTIKVSRSTEVMAGQFCDSDDFIFTINDIEDQIIEITGPEVLCYDAVDTFQIIDGSGSYIWEIDPPYMGTIIEGDSTAKVTIQWHYNPEIEFATLSTSRELCGNLYETSIDVYFEPFVPEIMVPDSLCQNDFADISVKNLSSYQTIEFYVNGILEKEDVLSFSHVFRDTGYIAVRVKIVNPNGCPGITDTTKLVNVIPLPQIKLLTSIPIAQCPKDSFQNVVVTIDYQEEDVYYIWTIDQDTIAQGFGQEDVYSTIITKDIIDSGASQLAVNITTEEGCKINRSLSLNYSCQEPGGICQCILDDFGSIDYLTPLECNLISFGGTLDFSKILNPFWRIAFSDSLIVIPILSVEDLTIDSFYYLEGSLLASVGLFGHCEGVITVGGVVVDSAICEFLIGDLKAQLYYPIIEEAFVCNEDLTYDVVLSETRLVRTNPPYNSTISWIINGESYEGVTIIVENQEPSTLLNITVTKCNLDGSYCCTNEYEIEVLESFTPEIILPNGSCENDLWLFTIDEPQNEIISTLWDFGDDSGSTLFLTEKGFLDPFSHNISVLVTNEVGCVASADITVESFQNNIDGELQFESDPCASFVNLTYIENSGSMISHFDWNNGNFPDTSTVQITQSGNYSVTVTDNHGCTDIAAIQNIKVNESLSGGLRFRPENCGVAVASVFANSNYTYAWYINGELSSGGSNIQISTPGEYEIKVVSTAINTEESCDSIVENIIIFPLPQQPFLSQEKIFCDPFITELTISNYPSALWNSTVDLPQEAGSILVSQNGFYNASVEDENGCRSNASIIVNEEKIPFDQLLDQCIQACREDLDSLSISIPGINQFYSNWTWVTVDTLGNEYEIQESTGIVTPLIITSDMYDYIQLQVIQEECILRSERIPLDIEICTKPEVEPPVEIICEPIDSDHASCGQSIYKCLLSEENGGPKLYFEGNVILPMDAVLCSEDSLTISLNNGEIVIVDLQFEEVDGKIMAFYSANIIISDADDYKENGTIMKFDFCNEAGEIAFCYEYTLPYRSCNKDFSCLIDFNGISSGSNQMVDVNYCLNLSEVVQDNCTLSTYGIRAIISGDVNIKTIYTQTLEGDFDNLHCISIPISQEDFFGGDFQCIELMIEGDCPGISCSEYQCGIFGSSNLIANTSDVKENELLKNIEASQNIEIENTATKSFDVFPNPTTGFVTIELRDNMEDDWIILKNVQSQTIQNIQVGDRNKIVLDLSDQVSGLYSAIWVQEGKIIASKILILVR